MSKTTEDLLNNKKDNLRAEYLESRGLGGFKKSATTDDLASGAEARLAEMTQSVVREFTSDEAEIIRKEVRKEMFAWNLTQKDVNFAEKVNARELDRDLLESEEKFVAHFNTAEKYIADILALPYHDKDFRNLRELISSKSGVQVNQEPVTSNQTDIIKDLVNFVHAVHTETLDDDYHDPDRTKLPTFAPSERRASPSKSPTKSPTRSPSGVPSALPSISPTVGEVITSYPSEIPSRAPTQSPTRLPTTFSPSHVPSDVTSVNPTENPTAALTENPSVNPTGNPSVNPTGNPTAALTGNPSVNPTATSTGNPSVNPTATSTGNPTGNPTAASTENPSVNPTATSTGNPTGNPTAASTENPSVNPTENPTAALTGNPSVNPSQAPTSRPSPGELISLVPTSQPSAQLTDGPTSNPSTASSSKTSAQPSNHTTAGELSSANPTSISTEVPTADLSIYKPTIIPSYKPTHAPQISTDSPTDLKIKSDSPTLQVSVSPTLVLTNSENPTISPTNRAIAGNKNYGLNTGTKVGIGVAGAVFITALLSALDQFLLGGKVRKNIIKFGYGMIGLPNPHAKVAPDPESGGTGEKVIESSTAVKESQANQQLPENADLESGIPKTNKKNESLEDESPQVPEIKVDEIEVDEIEVDSSSPKADGLTSIKEVNNLSGSNININDSSRR